MKVTVWTKEGGMRTPEEIQRDLMKGNTESQYVIDLMKEHFAEQVPPEFFRTDRINREIDASLKKRGLVWECEGETCTVEEWEAGKR